MQTIPTDLQVKSSEKLEEEVKEELKKEGDDLTIAELLDEQRSSTLRRV